MVPAKCDIQGVDYEKGYLQCMDQVSIEMAGVLGLGNTTKLWDLYLHDSSTRPILLAWLDIRNRTFGANLKHSHTTLRPAIVNMAFDPKMQPVITSPTQPALSTNGVDEKLLAPFTCLWFSWKLVKAKPTLFIRSQLDSRPPHVDPYDITHAYKLVSWIYRKQNGSKIPSTRPQNHAAQAPVFFHEGLGATTLAGPSRSVGDLLGVSSREAVRAMENANAVAVAQCDEEAMHTLKLDVVGELADAIYNELNPGRQVGVARIPCVPVDRLNLLQYLMEIDQFQHDCVLYGAAYELPGDGSASVDATCNPAPTVPVMIAPFNSSKSPSEQDKDQGPSNKANGVSAMDASTHTSGLKATSPSTAPNPPSFKLEYILENSAMVRPDITPCSIATVELVNPERIQAMHKKRYAQLIREFKPNEDPTRRHRIADAGSESHSHRCALRGLCLLAFSTRIDQFVSRINARHDLTDLLRDYAEKEDRGFAVYYANTTLDPAVPMPSSPLLQGSYLAMDTPKLRYLLKILQDEGAFDTKEPSPPPKKRFIVVAHWPLVLWVTEMFLNSLSIPFVTVQSSMSAKDRRKAISNFTSPKQHCQVLLTNFNCGTRGFNLHKLCSRMVVMEPPLNLKRLLHAIGSIHRIGQKQRQKVWLLYQDYTFNRWVEANNTLNALPWIAAKMENHGATKGKVRDITAEMELSRLLGRSCNFFRNLSIIMIWEMVWTTR